MIALFDGAVDPCTFDSLYLDTRIHAKDTSLLSCPLFTPTPLMKILNQIPASKPVRHRHPLLTFFAASLEMVARCRPSSAAQSRRSPSRLFKGPLLQIPAGHLHVFWCSAGRAHGGRKKGGDRSSSRFTAERIVRKKIPFRLSVHPSNSARAKKSEIEISKLKTNPRREGGNPNPLASLVSSLVSLSFSCRCWRWVFVLPCAVAGAASLQSFAGLLPPHAALKPWVGAEPRAVRIVLTYNSLGLNVCHSRDSTEYLDVGPFIGQLL